MRTIEQRKYNYSQGEILLLSWVTGGMKKWQKCVAQEEIWFAAQTNPIELFPKFDGSQLWCRNWDSHWNEIWKAVETNPIERFPKFEAHSEAPSSFEEVSWHFVKKKNSRKHIQKWIQMHGRANQSRNTTFEHFSLSWGLLKILHQGGRGCGSRLSIWWWLELYLFWPSK